MFGDYYWFAQDHDPKWDGQQGFWLRRIYFTFDYTFNPRFMTRLRLEANSNGTLANTNLTAYVKDAYLRWTVGEQHNLLRGRVGLSYRYPAAPGWHRRHGQRPGSRHLLRLRRLGPRPEDVDRVRAR